MQVCKTDYFLASCNNSNPLFPHNTASHDDAPPYKVWLQKVEQFKTFLLHKAQTHRTEGQTNRWTNRQWLQYTPPPPLILLWRGRGGIKMVSHELISGVASQEKEKETCAISSLIRPYTLTSGVMSQAEKNCPASSECPTWGFHSKHIQAQLLCPEFVYTHLWCNIAHGKPCPTSGENQV